MAIYCPRSHKIVILTIARSETSNFWFHAENNIMFPCIELHFFQWQWNGMFAPISGPAMAGIYTPTAINRYK